MARRALVALVVTLLVTLLLAAPAMAGDNGEGLLGEANDKVITFFGLSLVVFFPAVAVAGNVIHHRLERRRERREAAPGPGGHG